MGELIYRAMRFAIEAHAGQKYGKEPYWTHPRHAVSVARYFGLGEAVMAAAWLHDVVEDTPVTVERLEAEFGPVVAGLVGAVTEPKGFTRWERHPAAWAKLRAAGHDAVALKLSDRIANVEASLAVGGDRGLFRMYAKEHGAFKAALGDLGPSEMWELLDKLVETEV